MINLSTLQCIFANLAATYAIKAAAGVTCGQNYDEMMLAYNYMSIADAQANSGCDLTPMTVCHILEHQNRQSLTIQTCC